MSYHLGCSLIPIADPQIIAEVLIVAEPNHATVIVAAPVLRVDTNQHTIRIYRMRLALRVV